MKDGKEFRRFSRYPILVEFRIQQEQTPSKGKLLFDSLNLSAGGAFLRSDYLFEIGTTIEVSFKLPNRNEPITTMAKVTWVTRGSTGHGDPGMGVQFTQLDEADRTSIEELVESYAEIPG